jgi:NitT/TauT family transport system permease protein
MVVFIGVFFQLVLMVADIVRNVPNDLLEISYTLGARTRQVIHKVIIPYSSPQILDSLRITMGWAWGWLMLAELVGASQGIGFMILKSQRYLLNANMIFGLLVLGVLGILTDLLFVALSKTLFRWVE